MKYGPGKFEGCGNYSLLAQYIYNESLDGCLPEIGSVEEYGWFALFNNTVKGVQIRAIISEGSNGSINVEYFQDQDELSYAWQAIEDRYEMLDW